MYSGDHQEKQERSLVMIIMHRFLDMRLACLCLHFRVTKTEVRKKLNVLQRDSN